MEKKYVIFTQNTMASVVATREILLKNYDQISAIVLASQLKGDSFFDQFKIAKKLINKSSYQFFLYKIFESKLYNVLLSLHKLFRTNSYKSNESKSIEDLAKFYSIPIVRTNDLGNEGFLKKIKDLNPSYILCLVAQILRKKVFETMGDKFINAHGSYLPEYRGPAQYFWYLLNEDEKFGVTIHFMEPGLDTGDLIIRRKFNYNQNMSAYKLHYGISKYWGIMLNEFIDISNNSNNVVRVKQDENEATFTRMPTKEDVKEFKKKRKKWVTVKDFLTYY